MVYCIRLNLPAGLGIKPQHPPAKKKQINKYMNEWREDGTEYMRIQIRQ